MGNSSNQKVVVKQTEVIVPAIKNQLEIPQLTLIQKQTKKITQSKSQKNIQPPAVVQSYPFTQRHQKLSEITEQPYQTIQTSQQRPLIEKINWPQNHIYHEKLPDVKPPRKLSIKKTKQHKQAIHTEMLSIKENVFGEEVEAGEELQKYTTNKSEYVDFDPKISGRGKTAPVIPNNEGIYGQVLIQFGKTKKCRVSRML